MLTACTQLDAREQPLEFPHRSHTENQIDCSFCHEYADRERVAGIPQTELCGTCHGAMPANSDATRKLMAYVEDERPIPWVELTDLPDFTVFSHKRHVRADVACTQCHGDVGMSVQAPVPREMTMDWCVDCHEQSHASVDCLVCHK